VYSVVKILHYFDLESEMEKKEYLINEIVPSNSTSHAAEKTAVYA